MRIALTAACTLGVMSTTGCFGGEQTFMAAAGVGLGTGAATVGAMGIIMVADKAITGPRVVFHNNTEIPVQVRYWVGRMDITAPNGVAELRSDPGFARVVEPGRSFKVHLGKRAGWVTSNADAVVWVRLDPGHETLVPEGERAALWQGSDQPQWFELTRPLPFVWRAVGDAADLRAERLGEGGLEPLPKELWISSAHRDGHTDDPQRIAMQ